MIEKKWKCSRCGMIVTVGAFFPDKKLGGPCPRDPRGEHGWIYVSG